MHNQAEVCHRSHKRASPRSAEGKRAIGQPGGRAGEEVISLLFVCQFSLAIRSPASSSSVVVVVVFRVCLAAKLSESRPASLAMSVHFLSADPKEPATIRCRCRQRLRLRKRAQLIMRAGEQADRRPVRAASRRLEGSCASEPTDTRLDSSRIGNFRAAQLCAEVQAAATAMAAPEKWPEKSRRVSVGLAGNLARPQFNDARGQSRCAHRPPPPPPPIPGSARNLQPAE